MNLKKILQKYNFRFKKRLGQNFITDPGLLKKIVDIGEVNQDSVVVEIGPGIGGLTKALAERAGRVIAIEIDHQLMPILEDALDGIENIKLVQGDALAIDLDQLVLDEIGELQPYKIVANLPYYITTPLIMHFLEQEFKVTRIVVMVQKEVAERIVANPGSKEYGALTVSINLFAQARIASSVSKEVFTPRPAVDSAIVDLRVHQEPLYPDLNKDLFRRVVAAAFGQRRKTLLNSLVALGLDKERLKLTLEMVGIDSQRRGETLSLEEFVALTEYIS